VKTIQVLHILVRSGVVPCALAAGATAAPPADSPPIQINITQAVQEAIDHNLNLLAERSNLSIADARIVTAKLRPNPVVSAGLDYIDMLRAFSRDNQGGPTEYNLRTDFTFERGGKRDLRIEVARDAREVAQLQLLNATRTLVLDVQVAFVDVQQAKDNLALARENLQVFQSIVEVNSMRVRAGDLAKVELVRTQVAALQFQNAVRLADAKLKTTSVKLQGLMGRTTPSPAEALSRASLVFFQLQVDGPDGDNHGRFREVGFPAHHCLEARDDKCRSRDRVHRVPRHPAVPLPAGNRDLQAVAAGRTGAGAER